METDGINALNPAPDVGGVLPPQINRPGPVIDYLTRPMVPSPKSRRRDTLKGIAQFIPFLSGELAKAEGDKLGVALSGLDFLGAAGAPAKAVAQKGILSLNKVYHGSPNKNLTEASIAKSKQSENFMPHVSATDSPLLAKSFTKGELGNLPEGKIYESTGNFKIIDYTTDEGRKIWDSLGKTDYDRSINAKKAGFDGRKINNYEELKIKSFYPDIDYKDVKDASEIQFFKDLPLQPSSKGIEAIPDQATKNFSDAMKSKNLMFVHNTSEEAIRSFDAMGGLPSPSLAVTESEIPLKGFGKIQLIGKPEKFDPAIDPRNKVYSADAYTPRAPKKIRLAKKGAAEQLVKDYKDLTSDRDLMEKIYTGPYTGATVNDAADSLKNLEKGNLHYPENRMDELDRFLNSDIAKLKYLKDQGFDPSLPTFKSAAADPRLLVSGFEGTKGFKKWAKKEKNKYLSQDGVLQYFDDFEETMVTKPYTLENAVNSMIKETQRGGEGFAGGYSPARMKALMSKEFKDLPDIKAERGRLTDKPPSAMDLGEKIDDLLVQYNFPGSNNLYYSRVGSNMLNDIGIAIEDGKKFDQKLLKDAYNQNIDFDELDKFTRNKFEYDNPPKGFLDDLEDIFIKNATRNVEYFEAKPIRAVGFDEFAGAIVPKDTSKDVIDILQKRGLKVIKQTDADFTKDFFKTGARKKHFQDQMFSFVPVAGAGGVAALSIEKNTADEDKGLGSL